MYPRATVASEARARGRDAKDRVPSRPVLVQLDGCIVWWMQVMAASPLIRLQRASNWQDGRGVSSSVEQGAEGYRRNM